MSENTTPSEGRTLRARVGSVTTTRPRLYPLHASGHGVLARLAVALLLFSLLWAVGGCVEEDGPQEAAAPEAQPELRSVTQALAVGTDMDMELTTITNWPHADVTGANSSAKATDQKQGGTRSLKGSSLVGKKVAFEWTNTQSSIATINATDTVTLSLWYGWQAVGSNASALLTLSVEAKPTSSGTWTTLWTIDPAFAGTGFGSATVATVDVSSLFSSSGSYDLRLHATGATGNNNSAQVLVWWDDVILDVVGGSAPPTVANDTLNGGLAAVTHNSAPLQAEVTGLGTPPSADPRGFVWNTGGSPTTANTVCNAAGTGLGVFNQTCAFPTPGQQVFFRGYATNGAGNGYTSAPGTSFFLEPLQASGVGFSGVSASSMTVSWANDATAAGAIVVMKEGSDFSAAPNPADGTSTYTTNTSAWGDGTVLGEGRVIFNGAGTSVAVDGMLSSTTYYVRVYAYAGSGTAVNYQQDLPASGSQATSTPVAPTVTTPTATAIATTTATLGANVTSNGGATLTARGTCWGTSAAPTTNCVAEGGTTTGVFTQARTGLLEGRLLTYRGYATNSVSTSYSADGTFTSEPTQVSGVTFSNVSESGMRISWTQTSFSAGALVVLRATATAAGGDAADSTTYTASTTFGSGNTIGAGNFVVFAGNGTQVDVTGLSASTSYSVRIYASAGSGAAINYEQTTPLTGAQSTSAAPTPPLLSSPTATAIDLTTATLGATIDANGGSAITGRGTCWGTAPAPTTNCTSAGGTALGAYSHARTGMSAGTLVTFRGYADNGLGRGYSPDGSFYTEPVQASVVSFSAVTYNSMTVSWTNHASADGAIVVIKEGSNFSAAPDPVDGTTYAAGGSPWNDGNVLGEGRVIYLGAGTSVAIDSMSDSTTYYVRVYAYAGSGGAINFQQTAPASGSRATDALPPAPTLSSPTHSAATTTTATLGATVVTGTNISATGTVWSTDADPTNGGAAPAAADNNLDVCSAACSTGAFLHGRTGLPIGTLVTFAGYGTSLAGTGYSPIASFYTEPNQVTAATATDTGASTIAISWTAAVSAGGDGVLVVMREGAAPVTASPTDGTLHGYSLDYSLAPTLGDSRVVYRGPAKPQTITGLSATTQYYIAVFAYAGGGAAIEYQQDLPQTANATTQVDLTVMTTPGVASATPSSCSQVTVTAPFTGDSDNDGSVLVEYNTINSWPGTTGCAAVTGPSPRVCLISGLSGDTAYWTRVTYNDPDNAPSSQVISPVLTSTCGSDNPMVFFLSPATETPTTPVTVGGTERFVVQVYDQDGLGSILWGLDAGPTTSPVFPMPGVTCHVGDQAEATCTVVYFDANTTVMSNGAHTIKVAASDSIAFTGNGSIVVDVQNSASQPVGAGNLLRRTLGPQICTSCHIQQTHSAQAMSTKYGSWVVNCLTCHTPHDTANIYLVRETIQTPNSGPRAVDFRNLNPIDDFGFASTGGTGSGLCETCHTQTRFYKNTGGGGGNHPNPLEACTNCHGHVGGFSPPGCNSCHGGGNNAVADTNYWPDGQSATTLGLEDDEPGEHERHIELLSARLYSRTLAQLKADLQTDEKQKKLCAFCHADPFNAGYDPGTNQAWDDVHMNGSVQVGGIYGHRIWDTYAAPFATTDGWTFTKGGGDQGTCASTDCHNNTTSPAAQQWNDGAFSSCSMCHTVNPTTDATHTAHTGAQAAYGVAIDCDTCHDDGIVWNGPQPSIAHIDGSWTTDWLYTGDSIGKVKGSCGVFVCHNNGADGSPRTAYTWGTPIGTAGSCEHCHGDDSNTSSMSGAHTKHMGYLNAAGETGAQPCDDCHAPQTTASGDLFGSTHMNGEITLKAALAPPAYTGNVSVTTPNNYGTCTSGACHDVATDLGWTAAAPTTCDACHQDTSDLNDFSGRNKVASEVSLTEFNVTGHGAKLVACMGCHDIAQPHDFSSNLQGGNPFRLNSLFTGSYSCIEGSNDRAPCTTDANCPGGECSSSVPSPGCNRNDGGCHTLFYSPRLVDNHAFDTMTIHQINSTDFRFTPGCMSCHDPHGDGPTGASPQLFMISKEIYEIEFNVPAPPDTTVFACPGGTCQANGTCAGGTRAGLTCVVENSNLQFTNNSIGVGPGGNANEVDFSGLCQECHENPNAHPELTSFQDDTNPAVGAGHPPAAGCIAPGSCHDSHADGFGPPIACDYCHGFPPLTYAHAVHVNTAGFDCGQCHLNPGGDPNHTLSGDTNHWSASVITNSVDYNACWTNAIDGSCPIDNTGIGQALIRSKVQVDFSGVGGLSPNGTYTGENPDTGVYGTCGTVYCHGGDNFPAGGGGSDITPEWNVATTGDCGTCHGATAAAPPTTFAHAKHTSSAWYGLACNLCHVATTTTGNTITNYSMHVNGAADVAFDTGDSRLDGSTSYTGTLAVGDAGTDANDICSALYCHGSGTPFPAASQGSDTTPEWSNNATAACGTCHGASAAAAPGSFAHTKHASSAQYGFACKLCHVTVTDGAAITNKSLHVNLAAEVAFDTSDPRLDGGSSYGGTSAIGDAVPDGLDSCSATYCHSPGTDMVAPFGAAPADAAFQWDDTLACGACHGDGTSGALPGYGDGTPKANKHPKHVTANTYGCERCHTSTTTTGTTITTPANHVNLAYTVDAAGTPALGTFTYSAGSCTSTNCHGGNAVAWSDGAQACEVCHTEVAGVQTGVTDVNNFSFGDWTQSKISDVPTTGEYDVRGHGSKGVTCNSCHTSAGEHDTSGTLSGANPFRLSGSFSCTDNSASCHDGNPTASVALVVNHTRAAMVTAGYAPQVDTWTFTPECMNCHDPHGDGANLHMVQKEVYETPFGLPAGPPPAEPTEQTALVFTDDSTGASPAGTSYADTDTPFSSICQECHETTDPDMPSFKDGLTAASTGHPSPGANPGNCSDCHTHDKAFMPAGGGCDACHLSGTNNAAVAEDQDSHTWDGVKASIDLDEWNMIGHGGKGSPSTFGSQPVAGCPYCHDLTTFGPTHPGTQQGRTNYYMLANITPGTPSTYNQVCTVCHGGAGYKPPNYDGETWVSIDGANVGSAHNGTKHSALGGANSGGLLCWDCHDPHGDRSGATSTALDKMIQRNPVITHNTGEADNAIFPSSVATSPYIVQFQDATTGRERYSDTTLGQTGVCNVCHTNTSLPVYQGQPGNSHYTGSPCMGCHKHDPAPAFQPQVSGPCTDANCHGQAQGTRRQIVGAAGDFSQGTHVSYHINNGLDSELPTPLDCVACHAEGNAVTADVDSTYHIKLGVNLRHADGTTPASAGDVLSGAVYKDWATISAAGRSEFCMSCHDTNGATVISGRATDNNPLNPFNDGLTNGHEPGGMNYDPKKGTGDAPPHSRGRVVDVKAQFNPTNPSHHAVIEAAYATAPTGLGSIFQSYNLPSSGSPVGWTSKMECEDCHYGSATTKLNGHGTTTSRYFLRDQTGGDSTGANSFTFCLRCHQSPDAVATAYNQHAKGTTHWNDALNIYGIGCLNCHGGGYSDGGETVKFGSTHGTTDWSVADDNGGGSYIPYAFTYGNGIDLVSTWSGTAVTCSSRNALDPSQLNGCTQHGSQSYSRTSGARTYTPLK